jgi:hypothetical protein
MYHVDFSLANSRIVSIAFGCQVRRDSNDASPSFANLSLLRTTYQGGTCTVDHCGRLTRSRLRWGLVWKCNCKFQHESLSSPAAAADGAIVLTQVTTKLSGISAKTLVLYGREISSYDREKASVSTALRHAIRVLSSYPCAMQRRGHMRQSEFNAHDSHRT